MEQCHRRGVNGRMMRRLISNVALGLCASVLFAQPDLSFEIASVKSNQTEAPGTALFPLGPGDAYAANGGRFRATNQALITYVRFAYRLGPSDLPDLPRSGLQRAIRHRGTGERRADQGPDAFDDALAPQGPVQAQSAHRATNASRLRSRAGEARQPGPRLRAHQPDAACESPIEPQLATLTPPAGRSRSIFQLPSLPCGSVGFATIGTPGSDRWRIVGNGWG